jgi:hypothetical protein
MSIGHNSQTVSQIGGQMIMTLQGIFLALLNSRFPISFDRGHRGYGVGSIQGGRM